MSWLILLYFIELGYSPFYESTNILTSDYSNMDNKNIYYITLDTEVILFEYLFIGGAIKTYMQDKKNSYEFIPFESDYLFRTGLRYKNLELGFRHFCLHPVRPYEIYYQPEGAIDGAYEEFYIRIKGEY